MTKWGPSTRLEVSRDAVAVPAASETSTVPSGNEPSENVTVPLGSTAALPVGVMVAVTTAVCP